MRINVERTQLWYKAFEIAVSMVEELRTQGAPDAGSVLEGEQRLRIPLSTLARERATAEFKNYTVPQQQKGYRLARLLADTLLAGGR